MNFQQRAPNAAFFDFQEPIHILGAGSIGLLWAASIRSAFPSYPVQLLLRKHHQHRFLVGSSPNKVAICVYSKHNITKRAPRTVQVPAALIGKSKKRPFQNLFVTTKAHQALPAVTGVVDRISPQTRIILLCNGALAIRETLRDFLKQRFASVPRIHLAMTTHGAYRDDDDELFHVVHAGYGTTSIEDYPAMAQLLDLAGLNCTTSSTLDRDLWYKLAANCVINPLTALDRCRNGDIRRSYEQRNHQESSFDTYMIDILQEVSMVAHQMTGQDYSVDSLQTYVETVIKATAANQSSMLQDILAGRDTEIDYLNGFVVQQGQQGGLSCPVNQQLVQDVLTVRNETDH
jgi:2-dehydropantoate 2-reductase